MKFMRAGAFAGTLALIPQIGMSEDSPVWRSLQPTWQPAAPGVEWTPVTSPTNWPNDWLKKTDIEWKPVDPPAERLVVDPGEPAAILLPPVGTPRIIDLATAYEPLSRIGTYLPSYIRSGEPGLLPPSAESEAQVSQPAPVIEPEPISVIEAVVESLEVPPRELIEVEQLPVQKIATRREMILPPADGKLPEPGDGKRLALLGKPIHPLQRVRGWFKKDDVSETVPVSPGLEEAFVEAMKPTGPTLTFRDEFLMWWMKNDRVPVLATTGTPASGGIIGQPGTQSLFGPGPIDLTNRQGERSRATLFFHEDGGYGIDASFMFLGPRHSTVTFSSEQFPVISRPVFVLNQPPGEFVETVAFPGFSTGFLQIESGSRFWGADANLIKRLCDDCNRSFDVFVGYRYYYFAEQLNITEGILAGPDAPDPEGTVTIVNDRFSTRNLFNGGQVGFMGRQNWNRWSVDVRGSVAMGVNQQTVEIYGSQLRRQPGLPREQFTGGLLAAQSNVGRYNRRKFSVAPDVSLNLGYQITPSLRGFVGYSALYWTNVVRPGAQVDRVVDLNFIPNSPSAAPSGQRRPAVLFRESNLFAHGMNMGMEWAW